jgi:CheY-like chemotaxis protein
MTITCGTSVLVVDDHPDTAKMLAKALRKRGLEVETVQSGEDALRLVSLVKPQVVVMDEMMPGISGINTVQAMRQNHDLRDIKVVFYSADYDLQKQRKAFDLGVTAWMVKGVTRLDELTHKVAELCTQGPVN